MLSVGVDLECIERFTFVLRPGGVPFYRRVYTPTEQAMYGADLIRLALCFTVKEAVSKVLGTGLWLGTVDRVDCRDIEVLGNQVIEQPFVVLHGQAASVARQLHFMEVVVHSNHNSRLACTVAASAQSDREASELRAITAVAVQTILRRTTPL
jgi:phosphopantetheine--protein transferase-like protein